MKKKISQKPGLFRKVPFDYLEIAFFIKKDGTVTISSLIGDMLPVAVSLNPSNPRLRKFMEVYHGLNRNRKEI